MNALGFQFYKKNYQKSKLKKFVKLQRFCTQWMLSPFHFTKKNVKIKSCINSWKHNGSLLIECLRLLILWEKLPKSKVKKNRQIVTILQWMNASISREKWKKLSWMRFAEIIQKIVKMKRDLHCSLVETHCTKTYLFDDS